MSLRSSCTCKAAERLDAFHAAQREEAYCRATPATLRAHVRCPTNSKVGPDAAHRRAGETISEGGFQANKVSAASLLDVQSAKDKNGKTYYKYEILTRTGALRTVLAAPVAVCCGMKPGRGNCCIVSIMREAAPPRTFCCE